MMTREGALIRQTNYELMMNKKGSTKIVTFMTPRAGFLMLGMAILVIIVNMYYLLLISIYSTLIAIV